MSVVSVNWRAPHLALAAIEILAVQTHNLHRTYIIDNGSADGSIERFEEALVGVVDMQYSQSRTIEDLAQAVTGRFGRP